MTRKFISKLCLIFGISGGFLLLHNSCEDRRLVSLPLSISWYYINETKHFISYLPDVSGLRTLNVAPFDTTIYIMHGDTYRILQIHELGPPPIRAYAVMIDGVRIDSMLAQKVMDISNYEYKRHPLPNIRGRRRWESNFFSLYFRFTYENITPAKVSDSI